MFTPLSVNTGVRAGAGACTHRDQAIVTIEWPESTEQTIKLSQQVHLCTDGRLLVPLGVIEQEA